MNELTLFTPIKAELSLEIPNLMAIKKIDDEAGALIVSLGLKKLVAIRSSAESIRKSLKQPHVDAGKLIDERHKDLTAELEKCIEHMKRVTLDWNVVVSKRKEEERLRLIEAKRIEDERILLERSRDVTPADDDFDALLKSDEDNQRTAIIKEANVDVEQFVSDKKHVAALKAVDKVAVKGVRKVWTFEVTDEDQLPRNFLMADEGRIRKAIADGIHEIPGCRIWEEERLTARS